MNLSDTFLSASKAEWLEKVERDLKGKPVSHLNFSLADEELSPFWHREDALDIDLSDIGVNTRQLGLSIDIPDEKEANTLLLEYLAGGASYLHISTVRREKELDWAVLLQGVFLEMIECKISLEKKEDLTQLERYLQKNYAGKSLSKLELETCGDYNFENVFLQSDDVVFDLVSFVKRADELVGSDNNELIAHVRLTNDYLQNIAKVRAIKLLWQNVCAAHDVPARHKQLRVQSLMSGQDLSDDPYQNMIRLTQMCVSAMSGGVDLFVIPASTINTTEESTSFHRRVSRNIFQLMTMESHMDKVADPAAGSYAIDQMTAMLARKAWSKCVGE